MKKLVMLLVMLLSLAVTAVCNAASGKILDAEEAIVAKLKVAITRLLAPC